MRWWALVGMGVLAFLPLLSRGYPLHLATEVVAWALAATSLAFLFRTTGLVSLGHAAFFGGGAYVAALITRADPGRWILALPLALVLGFGVALVLGFLALRSHGIFFLMLTLAFSQLLYILVKQGFPQLTGGDDGLPGVPKPLGLEDPAFYYLAGISVLTLVLLAYRALLASPLGQILDALRMNEARLGVLGYDTRFYKLLAFGLSGALGALGGVFLAGHRGFVHPHDLAWTTSGLLLVMAVVGGMRSVAGGLWGAVILIALEAVLSSYTDLWNLFVGLFLMGSVVYALKGRRGESRAGASG